MPVLDQKLGQRFVTVLTRLERIRESSGAMTSYEIKFIDDMRSNWDGREAQADLGMTQWNPSANQWNYMQTLGERYP